MNSKLLLFILSFLALSKLQAQTITATIGSTNVSCNGSCNGTATVSNVSGGATPYTYSWAPSGGTGATASGLCAGNYTCTITDNNSAVTTKTVTIVQPPAMSTGTSKTNVACFGGNTGSASVSVFGGTAPYSYSWAPSGGSAASATGLAAGNYTVTVTDANSCSITRTFTITQPSALTTSGSRTDVSCRNGSNGTATVSASGGTAPYYYSWAPAGGTAASATGLAASNYTVTVTDVNNCSTTRSFSIVQPAAAVSGTMVVTNVACRNGTTGVVDLTPTGGTPGYTYNWSGGITTQDRTGLAAGTYTVVITDANACTGTVTATVTQPAAAVSGTTVVTNVACFGGSTGAINFTPTGGIPPYTFNWSNGPTTEDRTGLAAGGYAVVTTDANGCTSTINATVTQPAAAVSGTTVVTNVACFGGSTGAINFTPTGGIPPYTFNWSNGPTTEDRTGLAAGTYTVTATDANGCTGTVNATLTQPAGPISTWLGGSTDWHDAANWSCGLPDTATDVLIDGMGITHMPMITTAAGARNITFSNSGTLSFGPSGSLHLSGNVSGTGLDASGAAISFDGTSPQSSAGFNATSLSITNTAGVSFSGAVNLSGDLIMNGSGGLSTSAPLAVGGTLALNNGNITLNSSSLSATTISGGSSSSYVVTNGTGTLDAPVANGATVKFPVGRSAYNPVTLSNTGNADVFSVRVYNGVTADGTEGGTPVAPSARSHAGVTWLIDDVNNAGAVVNMTLQFNNGQYDATYFDLNHAYLAHYNSGTSTWQDFRYVTPNQQAAVVAPGVYSVTNTISNFSPFTVTSAGLNGSLPLPVQLSSIQARNEGRVNAISWQSAEEKQLAYYEVERSTDARTFLPLEKTSAKGQAAAYSVYDRHAADGMNYYRLKMVDQNGSSSYSKVVHAFVTNNGAFVLKAFPQPAAHTLQVETYGAGSNATIAVTDITGVQLMRSTLTSEKAALDMSGLPAGIYFVQYKDDARQQTLKITKQ